MTEAVTIQALDNMNSTLNTTTAKNVHIMSQVHVISDTTFTQVAFLCLTLTFMEMISQNGNFTQV